ncbi:MAG TPA: sigma factor-like helix-turn-helix DNA-binding protein [Propionibacteriaceae bacterium]|nr:sigma factor-like helix-turn-helix DNA-binding protein [Propionibacteriaceae bacterium]
MSAPDPSEPVGEVNVGMLLRMLPVRERQALELVYGLGVQARGHVDASVEMGCSPSTVRRLVDSGMSHLRTLATRLGDAPGSVSRTPAVVTLRPEQKTPAASPFPRPRAASHR